MAHTQLAAMPLESLRLLVTGRIACSALAVCGCRTVADAYEGSALRLEAIRGVGLNMQSASVVTICEPQLKPSAEDQAIARAHRMGQLKSVQVYRLLNPDSIDERIEEILSGKEIVFGEYARDSELAEASGGTAIDGRAALRLIQGERDRLGVTGVESVGGRS